jgi:anthranilate synthase/indole-3-glycerol phosphate synthase/phosphoribosylanthranilate isomerase
MRIDDALAAKDAGADFVGLMFAPNSRRRLDIEEAQAIVASLGRPLREIEQPEPPPLYHGPEGDAIEWFRHGAEALGRLLERKRPLTVGVFEDQPLEEVNTIADEVGIDLIQLSGRESWADCLLANRQVIKTVDMPPGASGAAVVAGLEAGSAIACLLDDSRGRGILIDHATARSVAARLPVWLAGGLTPENVSDVVRDVRPWLVDVSSGVETDGAKDARKVRAFVQAVGLAVGA